MTGRMQSFCLCFLAAVCPAFADDGTNPVEAALSASAGSAKTEAIGAGADSARGYAGTVLEKFLPYWEPPAGSSGVLQVLLRLGSDGRLLFCETKKGSGNKKLDESPCLAALKPKDFGTPPYGAATEVWLSLATDRQALFAGKTPEEAKPATSGKELSYAERVMKAVRPHVDVPEKLEAGTYTVELRVRIARKNDQGGVEQVSIAKSSGRGDVDAAILAALCTPGILPAPDEASADLRLAFTVKHN